MGLDVCNEGIWLTYYDDDEGIYVYEGESISRSLRA